MTTPEFSRPLRLDAIGDQDHMVEFAADESERAALARRFDLVCIDSLQARFAVRREAAGIFAKGHVTARVTQSCTVTGDPLSVAIDEEAAIRFLSDVTPEAEEIELGETECDTIFYTGSAIDLGEAAAETMALALDPYPRGPNAESALRDAGVLSEEQAGPFGALAGLKAKLGKAAD
jgi:uncharacterized metal-binding protein YceD (DUF177 family)